MNQHATIEKLLERGNGETMETMFSMWLVPDSYKYDQYLNLSF
jgi:hypothetical protein